MFGAIAKSYFAEKLGVDRKRIVVVSIMPCLAKKYEASRPEFAVDGNPDVDISIYTRELARLIRYANINFAELPDSDFDRPLGESTGAGVIFGTTGGVIEAACRTAYELYTKKTLPKIDFEELRGLEGIRSATIDFDGTPIKIGIAHGLGNARRLVEEVKNGMVALSCHRSYGMSGRLYRWWRPTVPQGQDGGAAQTCGGSLSGGSQQDASQEP